MKQASKYCPSCGGTGYWHEAPEAVILSNRRLTGAGLPPCPGCGGSGKPPKTARQSTKIKNEAAARFGAMGGRVKGPKGFSTMDPEKRAAAMLKSQETRRRNRDAKLQTK